jgi:hypothetical protein
MLTTLLTLQLDCTLSSTLDLGSSTARIRKLLEGVALTDGAGLNQANRVFSDTRSLNATSSESLDLFDFGGARDPLGALFALSKIKAILIANKATVAGQVLTIGGEGSSAEWESALGAGGTLQVQPGGVILIWAPSAAGYAVADATNHLLKIDNPNAAAVSYDIVVVGAE